MNYYPFLLWGIDTAKFIKSNILWRNTFINKVEWTPDKLKRIFIYKGKKGCDIVKSIKIIAIERKKREMVTYLKLKISATIENRRGGSSSNWHRRCISFVLMKEADTSGNLKNFQNNWYRKEWDSRWPTWNWSWCHHSIQEKILCRIN